MSAKKNSFHLSMAIFLIMMCMAFPKNVLAVELKSKVKEADKGYVEYTDPVTVEVIPGNASEKKAACHYDKDHTFELEKTVREMDREYDKKIGSRMSEVMNDHTARIVKVRQDDLNLLNEFAAVFEKSYSTKTMPDLSDVYNLDNQERRENMLLQQTWIYQTVVPQPHDEIDCESEVKIKAVRTIEKSVREVVFQLIQNIQSEGHEQVSGNWFIADITDTEEGPRIIHLWVEDTVFQLARQRVDKVLRNRGTDSDNASAAKQLEKEIFEDAQESEVRTEPAYQQNPDWRG
ncbi:MAG: hypothetical protein Q4C65_07655 [Eubacteriales bacterium]|nr:hypothetical protein [Eubacteriales bacterium]